MGRPIRGCLAGQLVELTTRTIHGRFLLRPSSLVNVAIKGTLGRAQRYYGMRLCAAVFLSNHYHLLVVPESEEQLASFIQFLNGNLARQLGRLHNWREKFWGREYRPIPVSHEPEAQIERFRYILEQGVKENLVERPGDWPGVQCVHELTTGVRFLHGMWHERTAENEVRRSGKVEEKIRKRDFLTVESVELSPPPFLEGETRKEAARFWRALVRLIERESRERRQEDGKSVLGKDRIEREDPHDHPREVKRSRAPIAHAFRPEVYHQMKERYRAFVSRYRLASERFRAGLEAKFPEGSFPPPGRFVQYARAGPG